MCAHLTCPFLREIPLTLAIKKAERLILRRPACTHIFLSLSLLRRCLSAVTQALDPG